MSEKSVPPRIWEYVSEHATKGDVDNVIDTIDQFCYKFENRASNVGDVKGKYLDQIVRSCNPKIALEIGAYAGYSALRISRALPADGKLYSIENNESFVEVTRKMITFAGMDNKITVLSGCSQDVIRSLKISGFDFVFLDHTKELYKPDLLLLEECNLIHSGSVIAADNIVFPGCPEYLEYVRNSPKYDCTTYMSKLEYSDREDGIEKAVYKKQD
uniref:catechol O-methyltransferase n=1 Tax=Phallusia mammillata TaxID=59560 RepID=A0A6F9DKI8_9ASCI|nr:catechol O-methyltransferase-like [Phallusia mammillata]